MRRRTYDSDDDVSLFPFLSIIAAIIGVLTLMIAAVTLGQMNQEDVKGAVENAQKLEQLKERLAAEEATLAELRLQLDREQARLLESSASRQTELVKSRAELDDLMKRLAEARGKSEELQKVKIVIPELPEAKRETLDDMKRQLDEIKDRLAVLQRSIDQRNKPPEEAQVMVIPGGSGIHYTPRFVECTADAIVLHTQQPPLTIRRGEIPASAEFVALLEEAANNPRLRIVFLLRSDSLPTYYAAKRLCDDNDVPNGKLPVPGNGRLDFSRFSTEPPKE